MSKFHSRKITADGITFDSRKEYLRYKELLLLERAGAIQKLQRQVKYLLIPSQFGMVDDPMTGRRKRVCLERECNYIADFTYHENGELVVEDVKGFKTPEYKIKRKLMLHNYGIQIRET